MNLSIVIGIEYFLPIKKAIVIPLINRTTLLSNGQMNYCPGSKYSSFVSQIAEKFVVFVFSKRVSDNKLDYQIPFAHCPCHSIQIVFLIESMQWSAVCTVCWITARRPQPTCAARLFCQKRSTRLTTESCQHALEHLVKDMSHIWMIYIIISTSEYSNSRGFSTLKCGEGVEPKVT